MKIHNLQQQKQTRHHEKNNCTRLHESHTIEHEIGPNGFHLVTIFCNENTKTWKTSIYIHCNCVCQFMFIGSYCRLCWYF